MSLLHNSSSLEKYSDDGCDKVGYVSWTNSIKKYYDIIDQFRYLSSSRVIISSRV